MFWKLTNQEFAASLYERNRIAQKAIVTAGGVPGILAYLGKEPVCWIAVEPRTAYSQLARARVLKPIDDKPVWSITCFFTRREFRGKGITVALQRAAIQHVKKRGGRILEGYPMDPRTGRLPAVSVYMGLAEAFRKASFREVARGSASRPIFRYMIGE